MTDPANRLSRTASISSRSGSIRLRPSTPLGPRVRNRSSNLLETGLSSPLLYPSSDSRASTPSPLSISSPTSPISPRGDRKSLTPIAELQVPHDHLNQAAPPYVETPVMPSPAQSFKAISQTPPPKLTPPPPIKFESVPVEWKALPLEAALWTLSSEELQVIVSRAIRSSAREAFIRLVSVENLDKSLPAEFDRLNALKAQKQTKYRFLVQRRTMLLQALISNSVGYSNKDGEDIMSVVSRMTVQLSEVVAECDQIVEELAKISDQLLQIQKLLDVHWGSALAIAIRKLNSSYGRRTSELSAARNRITQLEAELEDAWKEAENIAREMDDYEAGMLSDEEGEAIIEKAEIVSVPASPKLRRMGSIPMSPKLVSIEPGQSFSRPISPPMSPPAQKEHFITPTEPMRGIDAEADVPDTVSIRSNRSTRSARSTLSHRSTRSIRGGVELSRVSSVTAARKRSLRASQGSLRLPTHSRKQSLSSSRPRTPHGEEPQPPVPELPLQFASTPMPGNASSTLLHFDSKNASIDTRVTVQPSNKRETPLSLDGIEILNTPPPSAFPYPTMDDIYLRHTHEPGDGIELVDRIPPIRASSLDRFRNNAKPAPLTEDIPSIWMNADAPKTPAERVESLMASNAKATPYQRLRTLTKRYSLPFPVFTGSGSKPRPASRGGNR
ncbi:hypothetical protein BDQ17DRAFT_1408166 [Cyathus striatus]|nr:hypothetical protein BDQ17DRAFT_1408166 [Cyathus striatus]